MPWRRMRANETQSVNDTREVGRGPAGEQGEGLVENEVARQHSPGSRRQLLPRLSGEGMVLIARQIPGEKSARIDEDHSSPPYR